MADHLDSVKGLARTYRTWAADRAKSGDQKNSVRHAITAQHLEAVIEEMERLRRFTQPIPASYGDLSDLPPELLKELSGIKADDLEQQLFTIIKAGGDEVELDAILIELFRRFQVVQTRKFLQNKLWRMTQKGMIWSVPGRKGVYRAAEPPKPEPEAKRAQPAFDIDLDDDVPF